MQESVRGQDEIPNRQREQINEHPTEIRDLPRRHDDEETGNTEDDGEEDEGDDGFDRSRNNRHDNQVQRKGDGGGKNESTSELHEDCTSIESAVARDSTRQADSPTNRILKQNTPHKSGTVNSSKRLWTVELIHRRR